MSAGREPLDESDGSFVQRLARLADTAGSVAALARRAGISQSGMQRYMGGGQPTRKVLIAIADALDVDLTWLLTGRGSASKSEALHQLPENLRTLTRLPIHSGGLVSDEARDAAMNVRGLGFCRVWLSQVGYDVAHLQGLYMRGDSMSPTLRNGDSLLINTNQTKILDGEIYAIRDGDKIYIRRLQTQIGGSVRLVSDNPAYEASDEAAETLPVLGRVVWKGGLLS